MLLNPVVCNGGRPRRTCVSPSGNHNMSTEIFSALGNVKKERNTRSRRRREPNAPSDDRQWRTRGPGGVINMKSYGQK